MIDLRRIRIGIEVGGSMQLYEGLRVRASGTKYANPLQNEATVTLDGLNTQTRHQILTQTSPYERGRKAARITVEAGRVSSGLRLIYIGDITSAEVASPPDVTVTIRAKTNNASNARVVAYSAAPMASLRSICDRAARECALSLVFEAVDKRIASFTHSGSASDMVRKIAQAGGVRAFVDDDTLIVKDHDKPLSSRVRVLTKDSGMVGIPKATEQGLQVSYLADTTSDLGGKLRIKSKMNPAMDGDYIINQLAFDLASHDDPFFYTALAERAP